MLPIHKKALFIGIDHYLENPLSGCCNDARSLARLFGYHASGERNFYSDFLLSSSGEITNGKIRQKLQVCLNSPIEEFVVYFSGHVRVTEFGFYFHTMSPEEGISFQEIMESINRSSIPQITIVLDCCFSGGLANLPLLEKEVALVKRGLSILASSHHSKPSIQSEGRGAFTSLLIDALKGDAADMLGNIFLSNIFPFISTRAAIQGHPPVIKSYSIKPQLVRKAKPQIALQILRRLALYFMEEDEFPLDLSYERSVDPRNYEKEKILEHLRLFRNEGLIKPYGAKSIYEAMVHKRRCILTDKGKYYKKLIEEQFI